MPSPEKKNLPCPCSDFQKKSTRLFFFLLHNFTQWESGPFSIFMVMFRIVLCLPLELSPYVFNFFKKKSINRQVYCAFGVLKCFLLSFYFSLTYVDKSRLDEKNVLCKCVFKNCLFVCFCLHNPMGRSGEKNTSLCRRT